MNGTRSIVVVTLNIVWNIAICVSISVNADCSHLSIGNTSASMKKITEPMQLNIRWMKDARLPLEVAPIEANIAVTQVPIFIPRVMNIAFSSVIRLAPAIVMRIIVVAEELCTIAVTVRPMRSSSIGLLIDVMTCSITGELLNEFIAALITCKPTNIIPMLPMIQPHRLTLSCLDICMNAPTQARAAKNAVIGRD